METPIVVPIFLSMILIVIVKPLRVQDKVLNVGRQSAFDYCWGLIFNGVAHEVFGAEEG